MMNLLISFLIVFYALGDHSTEAEEDSSHILADEKIAATSQTKTLGAIKGMVVDKTTRKPLVGANVTVEGTRFGAATNRKGAFLISKLPSGNYMLRFNMIGYAEILHNHLEVKGNDTIDINIVEMEEQPIQLKELVISAGSYSLMDVKPSNQTLTHEDIKMLGWAEDITRAVQRVPGVSGNDLAAKFYIRGGDVDEVLVLIDGMQIYKPFHQKDFGGGLFSTIDAETIESVDFSTGGFTAEYGDRMSGVLNMTTKRPRPGEKSQSAVGISLINSRAFSMRSFNDGKSSWMISARRGYLDILNRMMGNEFKLNPTYYDILGKIEHKLSEKQVLSTHVFIADDTYKLDEEELEPGITVPNIDFSDTHYGSKYGWLTLKSSFRPNLFTRSILYGGLLNQDRFWNNFDNDPKAHFNSGMINDTRNFQLWGFKQDWNFEASSKLFIKFGYDLKRSNVDYNYSKNIQNELLSPNDTILNRNVLFNAKKNLSGNQFAFYLSTRFRVLPPLTLETGIRYDYASYTQERLWSPRVNALYSVTKKSSLRGGWGYYYQTQSPDELRIQFEETSMLRAQKAEHFVLGVDHQFDNGLYFRSEAYLKRITRVPITYATLGADIDEFYPESRDDLVKLSVNNAAAKGLEFYLKYDSGEKFSWWLSYVLSKTTDNITDVTFAGNMTARTGVQSRPWDQRHTLNIDAYYRLNPGWQFNLAWQYRSGWSFTDFDLVRLQRPDGTYAYFHDYEIFNTSRYPSYQRLDARINKYFYTSKGKITLFLHVINVLNHTNVSGQDHEITSSSASDFTWYKQKEKWLGITPFVGVVWEF